MNMLYAGSVSGWKNNDTLRCSEVLGYAGRYMHTDFYYIIMVNNCDRRGLSKYVDATMHCVTGSLIVVVVNRKLA